MFFRDRRDAGNRLAHTLQHLIQQPGLIVLGIPRGGVIVAAEVARELGAPLDIIMVRKLGAPEQPELAIGAVATDGTVFLNEDVVSDLNIPPDYIEQDRIVQLAELAKREALYRRGFAPLALGGQTVIVVDDGVATGATTIAALRAVRKSSPERLMLAVPVAPALMVEALERECDEAVFLATPDLFLSVGRFYDNFAQVTDTQVIEALQTH
ncbi:MAG TPA: phosphoribosyltransferase [Anaerolineae bacterium]